nr:MAG TPA: hypothetical protein [Caudoviricetes sp.]
MLSEIFQPTYILKESGIVITSPCFKSASK